MRKTPFGVAAFEIFNSISLCLATYFATAKLSDNTYRAETNKQLVCCLQNDFPVLLRQS